jgi:hypothetical protein
MSNVHVCGTVFVCEMGGPEDNHGCRRPSGHSGPHEFVEKRGTVYRWETDWQCDCEHCLSCDGDFCTVYWTANEDDEEAQGEQKPVDASQRVLF